ncbi:MAG: hypothetical protein NUV57_02410 [archaeon]|nr:hypothetical protein [archaeon]
MPHPKPSFAQRRSGSQSNLRKSTGAIKKPLSATEARKLRTINSIIQKIPSKDRPLNFHDDRHYFNFLSKPKKTRVMLAGEVAKKGIIYNRGRGVVYSDTIADSARLLNVKPEEVEKLLKDAYEYVSVKQGKKPLSR